METCRILVLNGPNLGHVGVRQPEIYGCKSFTELPGELEVLMGEAAADIDLAFYQNNSEGALIDRLEAARAAGVFGIVLNAGAFTHTSLALADALAWIGLPVVEVHLSNIFARTDEPLRQKSLIGKHCVGVIAGLGLFGYALAIQSLWRHWKSDRRR